MTKAVLPGILLGLLAAAPAQADPRDDAMSGMMRCTGIADAQSRLACYDGAMTRVRGAILAPPASAPPGYPPPVPQHSFTPAAPVAQAAIPPPAPPPRPPHKDAGDRLFSKIFGDGGPARPPQTNIQQFGSESIASHGDRAYPTHRDGDTIDAISARLVSYRFAANRRLIVTLDNGQDWLETGGDNLVGYLAHPALYYSAQVERGSNGSYAMTLTGIFRTIEVRRIR